MKQLLIKNVVAKIIYIQIWIFSYKQESNLCMYWATDMILVKWANIERMLYIYIKFMSFIELFMLNVLLITCIRLIQEIFWNIYKYKIYK